MRPDEAANDPSIARVLEDAFGASPREDVAVLAGGRSGATLLSVTVEGRRYVVRKPDPSRPLHERRVGRELACVAIAAASGVAPPLRHLDRDACVTVSDRIDASPLGQNPAAASGRLARVVEVLHKLHRGPAFPEGPGTLEVVRHFEGMRATRGDALPSRLLAVLADASKATARFAGSAPCHNDLNPGNILETAERVYFVDWETAAAGDPYFDLATLALFAFPKPDQTRALLDAYLERTPRDEDVARLTVTRVIALAFYTVGFVTVADAMGRPVDLTTGAVPLHDAFAKLRQGMAGPEVVAASLYAETLKQAEAETYGWGVGVLGKG
jgi:aminoglycoside phosphotransferase (APT) family kinase protein